MISCPVTVTAQQGSVTATQALTWNVFNTPRNRIVQNFSFTTNEDVRLTVDAPGLLANASDPDGNALTAALINRRFQPQR